MNTKSQRRVIALVKEVDLVVERGRQVHDNISKIISGASVQDLAALLDIDPDNRQLIFAAIDPDKKSEIMDIINGHTLRQLTSHMNEHDLAKLIESSPSIVSQKIASTVERSRLDRLIPMIVDESRRHNLQQFANYPKRSIGRIMQAELVIVHLDDKIETALKNVEEFASIAIPVYQVYVVNKKAEFVGTIHLSSLLRERSSSKISQVIIHKPPLIRPQTTQSKVAQLFREYDLIEAPVVQDKKLVGRVLVDDVLDIVEQEFAEDITKFAGITSDETMQTPALQSSFRRLPWMVANIFLYLMAVSIIMPFQETIAAVTALAVIMPVVSNVGGNVGIQAISVSIRTLSANRPDWKLAIKEFTKELRVGLINGAVLGVIVGVVALIWFGNAWLGVLTVMALLINTVLGSVVGGVLPIIIKRLGKDPAMMGGAVLTTVTDFCGFLIFLSLAKAFLPLLV